MGTPHKHAEIIKAWADGAEIEVRCLEAKNVCWHEWENVKEKGEYFQWKEKYEYRIKPEPKPDVDVYKYEVIPGRSYRQKLPNLKLTFDRETGTLKAAEVLK